MRDLLDLELNYVGGAGAHCSPSAPKEKKGNNGFGNGADENRAAPGGSGKTGAGKEGSFGDARGER